MYRRSGPASPEIGVAGYPFGRVGHIHGNLKQDFANGLIKLSGQYTNDRNGFYLSLPTATRAIRWSASIRTSIRRRGR